MFPRRPQNNFVIANEKVYLDLSVRVERPRFEVSPAHVYALADMATAAKLLLPPNLFPQVCG